MGYLKRNDPSAQRCARLFRWEEPVLNSKAASSAQSVAIQFIIIIIIVSDCCDMAIWVSSSSSGDPLCQLDLIRWTFYSFCHNRFLKMGPLTYRILGLDRF
jgi:hypothetical protein